MRRSRHRFKHKIITPNFVLFADNGIDNPRHSYGYDFGLPALFSTKITSTFPILYACSDAERPVRCKAPHFLFRRRGLAAQETTAPDLQKPAFRKPHLSGQPGGRHVNAPPDKP